MAARNPQALKQATWHSAAPAALEATQLSWLEETGLLTQRLRDLCGADFNLDVLVDVHVDVHADVHADVLTDHTGAANTPMNREVLLCCGTEPCIYALTEASLTTLQNHPWLRQLGAASLGETLRTEAMRRATALSRSAFSFALLEAEQLPAAVEHCQAAPAWARRSEFQLDQDRLVVTEIFLDGLFVCEQQRVRAIG